MIKVAIMFIVSVLLSVSAFAQIPLDALPLVNSLSEQWYSGKTEAAIDSSIRLYAIYPPLLIERLHTTLSQIVKQDKFYNNANDYLEALIKKNNQGINQIVKPIYLWSKTIHDSDRVQLNKTFNEMAKVLGNCSDFKSKAERYTLLMLNEPIVKNLIDRDLRENLLRKVIRNLELYPNLDLQVKGGKIMEERAWNRYLLAYSYYMLYTFFDKQEEFLMKASKYSPDDQDVQVKSAYFYDVALLTGNVQQIGFQKVYQNYLTANHRTLEALALFVEITFNSPSGENLKALKDMYALESHQVPFNEYWYQFINLKGKKVPSLKIEFADGTLDLTKNRDYWVFIDVWGTWCSPCVKELPLLQEFFVNNNQPSNPFLKVYTFSFSSKNLATFMKDKHFTFPVFEIDNKVNDDFEITGYPTKILISTT